MQASALEPSERGVREDPPGTLAELLDRLHDAAGDHEQSDLAGLFESVGTRSFGPLLLVTGLIAVSPLSGIPGLPSLIGLIVALVAVQLLLGRRHFWLPAWVMRRRLPSDKLRAAARRIRRPAGWVDRLLRPRLVVLTDGAARHVIAALCLLIAVAMPPLELVPFSATIAGAALTAFGLALITHDGLLALLAIGLLGGAVTAVVVGLL